MRLSVALIFATIVIYITIAIGISGGNSADAISIRRDQPSGYTGTHSQSGYERELFAEIAKAWIQKSEQWFIKDYIVETEGRWNY